jgi:hypothetical protein
MQVIAKVFGFHDRADVVFCRLLIQVVQDGDFVEESMVENVGNACVVKSHDDSLNAMEMGTQVVNEFAVHNLETSTAEKEHEDSLNTIETCANEFNVQTLENRTARNEHDQARTDFETCEHDASESMVEKPKYAAVRNLEKEPAQEDEQNVVVTMDPVELHVETGEPGYIKLRTVGGKRTVPNCCAICLCAYEAGESIVWSSTKKCPHAFHEECVVEWLVKMKDGTPCPCCRQEFTDLSRYNENKKLADTPQSSFDVSVISL